MSTRQKSSLAHFLERHSASAHAVEPARAHEEPQSTPFFDQVIARVSGSRVLRGRANETHRAGGGGKDCSVSDRPMSNPRTGL